MTETTVSDAVLARLEALTTQVQAQAERLERLDALEAEVTALRVENARLSTGRATPTGAPSPAPATTSRRGMLRRVVGASAAAALLLVAKEAATAEANFRGNSSGGAALNYGIAGIAGLLDPAPNMPSLGSTSHGVLGVNIAFAPSPTLSAGVTGIGGETRLGVQGLGSDAEGVYGQSDTNAGVHGKSRDNAGVFAEGPIGVFATGTGTAAVYGASNGTYGVWGNSGRSAGLIGTSSSYIGVEAISSSHWGLRAKSPTYAGVFEGNVFVTGQVIALGGVVGVSGTSAGGSGARALAEDVGEGTLANGRTTVTLEQGFADAANGEYRVFLTELADLGGLYVAQKGPRQFEVRSRGGGQAAASGRFDYRVVAKLSGPPGTRPAPLAPPDLTTVKPAPKPPEPPNAPEPSGDSQERRQR